MATTIAQNAPLTIQAVKSIVRELRRDPADRDVALCDALVRKCFESADYQEGFRRSIPGAETQTHLHRKMKAIYIEQTGGPEVLRFGDRPIPEPAKDEVLVKLVYSGVNFTDINQRSGLNKIPVPAVLGAEGAGTS